MLAVQVWSAACAAAGAEDTAAAIRRLLPTAVPTRLLLPALASHLPRSLVSMHSVSCSSAAYSSTACDVSLISLAMSIRIHRTPTCILNFTSGLVQRTGARSTAELLDITAALLSLQKPGAAIVHAEAAFRFLLPALDVRQARLAAFSPEGKPLFVCFSARMLMLSIGWSIAGAVNYISCCMRKMTCCHH